MARLYGDKEDIEYGKVKNFFSKRFNKGLESDLLIGIYEDKETAEARNKEQCDLMTEKSIFQIKKFLKSVVEEDDFLNSSMTNVLIIWGLIILKST